MEPKGPYTVMCKGKPFIPELLIENNHCFTFLQVGPAMHRKLCKRYEEAGLS